jgi:hypothetical protein
MNSDRIKEIQHACAYPLSISVQQAMKIVYFLWRPLGYLNLHLWYWWLPNYKGTIIGTQACRCCSATRGKRVKETTPL